MSTEGRQPSEEELRAAYEAELKRITADDVVLQTIVSLLNLGGRRIGLAPGTEEERDLEQVRTCIDSARALLAIVEPRHGAELGPIKDALSQLQMAWVQAGGQGPGQPAGEQAEGGAPEPPKGEPEEGRGPAQSSGRLWVPGQ
jgi:hypothetical protein